MKRLGKWFAHFFLPPAGAPLWVRILPYAVLSALTLVLLSAGAYAWDYTNSPAFCGATCHTMPPEYTAYLASPHARIDCVDCHLGKGFIATRITRKAGDLKHVVATAFKTYEFPIRADELRPARETCERCHFPEKFSDDSLREVKRYGDDQDNTPLSVYLVLKTGGGSKRLNLGRGIHWHILNRVYYLATDSEEQDIPYVRVVEEDGSISEYVDVESNLDPQTIASDTLKEMDCITCHNRITHLVPTPEDTVDRLIASQAISANIPEIRLKAVEAYSKLYGTVEEGVNGIAGIAGYYQVYYPEFYAANRESLEQAISALQEAYRQSVFPEQNSNWTTHPNNVGHKDSPGCFRCHDGKHLDQQDQAIRLECNLCHAIPVVAGPRDFVADLEISRGPEPESHKNANWISLHHQVFDPSCESCHTTANPGGVNDSSFCSNSACHGSAWPYAGFDAPALREVLQSQLPATPTPAPLPTGGAVTFEASIGPLFQVRCGNCHGASALQGLNLTAYQSALAGGKSGPAILPGNPQDSLLVRVQSAAQPHFSQLSPQELELVVAWIAAGAPER
ncbi:MAG: NapC/NirT family cytochrome c [Anaerolineales bacterium]|nr:NapC/NirT family cytochrome c [Anaerolineales bacterium]